MKPEWKIEFQARKSASVIESLSSLYGVSLQDATERYYASEISTMIEDGTADMHCRSDKYLATLIWEENRVD